MSRPKRRPGSSRLQRGASPYAFAAAGIALVVVVAYVAFSHRVPLTGSGYSLRAVLADSGQMQPGSPVRVAGVNVGRVTAIDRGPGDSAVITMTIEPRGLPLHDDVTLKIRPRLFLEGSLYVELHPGSPSAPQLPSGATLPASHTARAVQIDELLSTLDLPARTGLKRIILELDRALAGGGAAGLRQTTRQLPGLLRQIAIVSQATQGSAPHDLSSMIRSTARVTGALGGEDGRLARLVADASTTASAIAAHGADVGDSLTQLDALERAIPAQLDSIDPAVAALRSLAGQLRPALAVAPRPLRRTAALVDQLGALSRPAELPRLLRLLAPTIQRAPAFERGLGGLLPLVAHVGDCVTKQAVPVLSATVPDGPLSTNRPAWQDLVHFAVGFVGMIEDFDGNGTALRLAGTIGDNSVQQGKLPSTTQLVGSGGSSVLGARPRWLGPAVQPPFRPDQDCAGQRRVGLSATSGTTRRHGSGR